MEILPSNLEEQLNQLETLGFTRRKHNEKILQKCGNFDLAVRYLKAKSELKDLNGKEKKVREPKEKKVKEPREKREREPKEKEQNKKLKSTSEMMNWEDTTTHLFLDGNNMLFVLGPIRSLALKKKNFQKAEGILERIAHEFTKRTQLEMCTLIFDDTNTNFQRDHFKVLSARPQFITSDDALVQMAKEIKKGIFVTSDRELIQRLEECGVTICKPKQWFQMVAKILHPEGLVNNSLDEWVKCWMEGEKK